MSFVWVFFPFFSSSDTKDKSIAKRKRVHCRTRVRTHPGFLGFLLDAAIYLGSKFHILPSVGLLIE
jgi:hypothetical protein